MKKIYIFFGLLSIVLTGTLCTKYTDFDQTYLDPRLSGGVATTFNNGRGAFGEEVNGLSAYDAFVHEVGDKIFEQTFVTAPAPYFQGLGPIYNNVSCISCHHNDGKGFPIPGSIHSGLLVRLSMPGTNEHNEALPVPGFGVQFQDKAISGKQAEGKFSIEYEDVPVHYPDGTTVTLQKPIVSFRNLYQPLPSGFEFSLRLAPPVFALGLLALIPEQDILNNEDPTDKNGDGITGKANRVWNPTTQREELGRFGLKANQATLLTQVAGAFNQDMGITTYAAPIESSFGQAQYDHFKDDPEVTDSMLDAVVFYMQTLAAPARRNVSDPEVLQGERLFTQINCSGCHKTVMFTGTDIRLPMLSNQRIQPFTDLLLHDMGEGLADNRPDFLATGREWRTAPLWGLGLLKKVNGKNAYYLHDGRARTIEEAILWHDGEAALAKNKFMQLTLSERKSLIVFLESL